MSFPSEVRKYAKEQIQLKTGTASLKSQEGLTISSSYRADP